MVNKDGDVLTDLYMFFFYTKDFDNLILLH